MVDRGMQDLNRQATPGAPALAQEQGGALTRDEQRGASAQATQGVERPTAAVAPNQEMLNEFQAEGPAPQAAGTSRTVNELAQDPAVRTALQQALDNGAIKYDSLKKVVEEGLQTGTFNFKSKGQEGVVKGIIADAIKPVPAPPPASPLAPEPEPPAPPAKGEARDPGALIKEGGKYDEAIKAALAEGKALPAPANAAGYSRGEAQEMIKQGLIVIPETIAIDEAVKHVAEKLGDSFDPMVGEILAGDPAIREARNSGDPKVGFQAAHPAVSDAVRYANQIAVKTGDFEPESIKASFHQAFEQATRKDLIALAEGQGVNIYPDSKPPTPSGERRSGNGRDKDAPIVADGLYDRAIKAAMAEGKALPAPADPTKGYTSAEARKLVETKQITLEEKAHARQTPDKPKDVPLAGRDDARAVLEYLNAGHGRDGARGVPFETYKQLGKKAQHEVAALVKALEKDPNANLPVTTFLAKDFKEKVFEPQPA